MVHDALSVLMAVYVAYIFNFHSYSCIRTFWSPTAAERPPWSHDRRFMHKIIPFRTNIWYKCDSEKRQVPKNEKRLLHHQDSVITALFRRLSVPGRTCTAKTKSPWHFLHRQEHQGLNSNLNLPPKSQPSNFVTRTSLNVRTLLDKCYLFLPV